MYWETAILFTLPNCHIGGGTFWVVCGQNKYQSSNICKNGYQILLPKWGSKLNGPYFFIVK